MKCRKSYSDFIRLCLVCRRGQHILSKLATVWKFAHTDQNKTISCVMLHLYHWTKIGFTPSVEKQQNDNDDTLLARNLASIK